MKTILSRKFVKYFLISFSIHISILLILFFVRYLDDIFNKGFSLVHIFRLIFHTSITIYGFSILFGFLIASIFSFRYYSKNRTFFFSKELLSGFLVSIFISFVFLGFNNWVVPKSNREAKILLYNMRKTAPGEELQPVDKSFFQDKPSMMSMKKISEKVDTLNMEIDSCKHQCDSLLGMLPDSIARDIFDEFELATYDIKFRYSIEDTISERDAKLISAYAKRYGFQLRSETEEKHKYIKEKSNRIMLPVVLIILFILGASYGYYYNDQKSFLLVILALYTLIFFYNNEQIIAQYIFKNKGATIFMSIVLLSITTIFLIMGLKKEQKTTQPNK